MICKHGILSRKKITKLLKKIEFGSKFETDLFKYQKTRNGKTLEMGRSKTGGMFWVITDHLEITIFDTKSAKIVRKIDLISEEFKTQIRKSILFDKVEVQKKENSQIEFLSKLKSDYPQKIKICFDESETLLIIPTVYGIAFYDFALNSFERVIGIKEKGDLFIGLSVFQGEKISNVKGVIGQGGASSQMKEADPLILAWCFKKQKFCIFSKRLPEIEVKKGENNPRDVLLEKAKATTRTIDAKINRVDQGVRRVVISTTFGDIFIKLFPEFTPKAVENFVTHAINGYYDNCVFHRVVKGYIQGGDPLNDGSGGESIWGKDFDDEFCEELKHDRPFTISMANSCANGNGSQFFITTLASPWLDKKHTIFGRVYKGSEIVTEIEHLKTDNFEKPLIDAKIFRIHPI